MAIGQPDPSHVNSWKECGLNYRKDRHGFCRPVDGHSPLLAEEQKDGGDQCSRVSDADPPNEVGDVPGPANGLVQSPGSNAGTNGVENVPDPPEEEQERNAKGDPPGTRWGRFDRAGHLDADIVVILLTENERLAYG